MPLTRTQRKQAVEGAAAAASAVGEAAVEALVDALTDSEDDEAGALDTPKKALRGKYGGALKKLYDQMVGLVDASALPLFRKHFSKEALVDFIDYLLGVKDANEMSLEEVDDDDNDDDSDASFEGDEEEEEEEAEETEEEEEDDDDEEMGEAEQQAAAVGQQSEVRDVQN